MALELVSPAGKAGAGAFLPTISADGNRVAFKVKAGLADTPGYQDATVGDLYLGSRGPLAWQTSAMSAPASYGFQGGTGLGAPISLSPELDRWLSIQGTSGQSASGQFTVFEAALDASLESEWRPRSPLLTPLERVTLASPPIGISLVSILSEAKFYGVSADRSHLFMNNRVANGRVAFLPDDPRPSNPDAPNGYVLADDTSGGFRVELLARDEASGEAVGGNCGAWIGGGFAVVRGARNQGAMSPDGTRVYLSTRPAQPQAIPAEPTKPVCDESSANPIRIMERLETPAGAQISELISNECTRPSPACAAAAEGNDFYEGASVDGSRVYFTTTRQLADSDLDTGTECSPVSGAAGCDLYLYDANEPVGQRLTQVSSGSSTATHPTVGADAGVFRSVAALSGDGSRVYFIASAALTDEPNPAGAQPVSGEPNLYLYEAESDTTSFVGTLSPADNFFGRGFFGNETSYTREAIAVPMLGSGPAGEEVGGDGHVLVLISRAPLTPDDLDGNHRDVYRFDSAAHSLVRVSKASPGGADNGPVHVEEGIFGASAPQTDFAIRQRWVSEDGGSIVFATDEPLARSDVDGARSPYLWTEADGSARLELLPGTLVPGTGKAIVPTISQDGDEVAFTSTRALVPADGDGLADIYVARANGGHPPASEPSPCSGEECQGPPAPTPATLPIGTTALVGPGNKQRPPHRAKKKHKGATKKKGRGKKGGKKRRSQTQRRRANRNRGGEK